MKTTLKAELPQLLLIAGMVILAVASWNSVPDRLPVHWGISGNVDRMGGKAEGLLLLPGLAAVLYLVLLGVSFVDPGRENYERFRRAFTLIRTSIVALLAYVYVLMLLAAHGVSVDMPRAMGVAVGLLFVVLGGTMGKIRPNWFVGIRTPWTLSSKLSWTRTHRLGGWLFLVGGFVVVAASIVAPRAFGPVLMVVVVLIVVVTMVYSYWIWRRDPDRLAPLGTRSPPR